MRNILSRIEAIAKNEGITIGALEKAIGASKGVLSRAINKGTDIQSKWLQVIAENYPHYSTEWLLAGRGEMLTPAEGGMPIVSHNPNIGVPYFNVDFIGGFNLIFNDQTTVPTHNIVFAPFDGATLWCNVTGHSMEPKINHGDIIALKECRLEDVQFGEIYAVVMDTIRTVKVLRKSSNPKNLLFVPVNTEEYDVQEFEKSRIIKVFEVLGGISKFF